MPFEGAARHSTALRNQRGMGRRKTSDGLLDVGWETCGGDCGRGCALRQVHQRHTTLCRRSMLYAWKRARVGGVCLNHLTSQ